MKNCPDWRFNEYLSEIITKQLLSNYLNINIKKNRMKYFNRTDVLSVSGEKGIVNQMEFQGRSFAGEDLSEYKIVFPRDIVYTKSPLKYDPFGIIKVNKGKIGIVSTLYAVYCGNDNTFSEYVEYYFGNKLRQNKYLKPLVNIGAKHDMKISNETVLTGFVYFPNIDEQKKISDYLTHFDKALTAQEKKVTHWQEVKKGMLQKIFSCEFRFKDDKGNDYPDWQEKIFEEEFIFLTSNTLSRNDLNYCGGEIKNIHYGDILTKFNDVLDVSSKEIPFINFEVSLKNKIYLQDGDVIFSDTAEDYTSGKVIEIQNVKNSLLVSGLHTIPCRPNKQYSKGFLGYYLNSNHYRKQILPLISGIKVMSISKSNLQKTFLKIPCLEEQKKIADYFCHLDKIISAESKILESMREMKKGLLQKLFV